MRARLKDALDSNLPQDVDREGVLVYLMGAYKAWHPEDFVSDDVDIDPEDLPSPFGPWDDDAGDYTEYEALAFMQSVRDKLRTGSKSVNAFIALDPDISTDEMDPATQSIEFAKAANVVALIVPRVGKNLGVGIETGSVLEADGVNDERVVFLYEDGVTSGMRQSLASRWGATVYEFEDRNEVDYHLRKFIVRTLHLEMSGKLDRLE